MLLIYLLLVVGMALVYVQIMQTCKVAPIITSFLYSKYMAWQVSMQQINLRETSPQNPYIIVVLYEADRPIISKIWGQVYYYRLDGDQLENVKRYPALAKSLGVHLFMQSLRSADHDVSKMCVVDPDVMFLRALTEVLPIFDTNSYASDCTSFLGFTNIGLTIQQIVNVCDVGGHSIESYKDTRLVGGAQYIVGLNDLEQMYKVYDTSLEIYNYLEGKISKTLQWCFSEMLGWHFVISPIVHSSLRFKLSPDRFDKGLDKQLLWVHLSGQSRAAQFNKQDFIQYSPWSQEGQPILFGYSSSDNTVASWYQSQIKKHLRELSSCP